MLRVGLRIVASLPEFGLRISRFVRMVVVMVLVTVTVRIPMIV